MTKNCAVLVVSWAVYAVIIKLDNRIRIKIMEDWKSWILRDFFKEHLITGNFIIFAPQAIIIYEITANILFIIKKP